jgi:hypothetical protein
MSSLTHSPRLAELAPRNGSNPTVTGRAFAARIATATRAGAELWLAHGDQALDFDLAADVATLTGVDAELWEQRIGESREGYLDRMATAILSTNPEWDDTNPSSDLETLVAEAETLVVEAEAARYRLLAEAGRIEREEWERLARTQAAGERRATRVSERLTHAAQIKAAAEEIDRTGDEPDDPSWSAAELRGVQAHSPFRSGARYRFRRSDGTLAPLPA